MAADPNPELRAELESALDVLSPQIRGLHDLSSVSVSTELAASVREQIVVRERRRDLINAVLGHLDATMNALNTLESDGYPALPQASLVSSQFEELQEENTDLAAAIGVFAEAASRMTVGLGAAAVRPPQAPGDD